MKNLEILKINMINTFQKNLENKKICQKKKEKSKKSKKKKSKKKKKKKKIKIKIFKTNRKKNNIPGPDEKPEIKKIKKQQQKKEFII